MSTYNTYNIGFINKGGNFDETQLDVENCGSFETEVIELINLILTLKEEMCIEKITYISSVKDESKD